MAVKRKPFRAHPVGEGLTLLLAPETTVAASLGGVEYRVAEDGTVEVPIAYVAVLIEHGFTAAMPAESASPA